MYAMVFASIQPLLLEGEAILLTDAACRSGCGIECSIVGENAAARQHQSLPRSDVRPLQSIDGLPKICNRYDNNPSLWGPSCHLSGQMQ